MNRSSHQYIGQVIDTTPDYFVIRLIEALKIDDTIEFLTFDHQKVPWKITALYTITGHAISQMRQDSLVCVPRLPQLVGVEKMNVIRAAHQPILEPT